MDSLRRQMAQELLGRGVIKDPRIGRAFARVPRHIFLEGVIPPEQAYFDQAVMLKFPCSSVSQPQVMASMLEILDLQPGMKVLEIGTASGYNAALLAEIAGDPELVYSMEREKDLIPAARKNLERSGYGEVNVAAGDGTLGWPNQEDASFERIMITAQTPSLPPPLAAQLKEGGKMVLPLVLGEDITLLVRVEKEDGLWGRVYPFPVSFVTLRGQGLQQKKMTWERRLGGLWRGMQRYCGTFPLDSPQLWGVFLFLLKELLDNKSPERPEALWSRYQAQGRPEIGEWLLEFDREGFIVGVIRREE